MGFVDFDYTLIGLEKYLGFGFLCGVPLGPFSCNFHLLLGSCDLTQLS